MDGISIDVPYISLNFYSTGILLMVRSVNQSTFYRKVSNSTHIKWKLSYNQTIENSLKTALTEKLGQAILDFIQYLETEHILHCVPSSVSSGLSDLPLDHIWYKGEKKSKTSKKLPTGHTLNGKRTYKNILKYFTTNSKFTPERIHELGVQRLQVHYREAVDITKKLSSPMLSEEKAVKYFRIELDHPRNFFNMSEIPDEESGDAAAKKCHNMRSAMIHCPVRYDALLRQFYFISAAIARMEPFVKELFYTSGPKITTPKCRLALKANFNPSVGSHTYLVSNKNCRRPAYIRIPFFLKRPGPIIGMLSTIGHEGRPGHHTQVMNCNSIDIYRKLT